MRPLSVCELLDIWERGRDRPQLERALALLDTACPDQTFDAIAALSIGERDSRLMLLRQWAFGARVTSVADCQACGTQVELDFDLAEVCAGAAPPADPLMLEVAGYTVSFRLPASHDLLALSNSRDAGEARRQLLARCVLTTECEGLEHDSTALPEQVTAAVVEAMARADPLADIRLALSCPACGHTWYMVFDIVAFYWSEIEAWAWRTLREVHTLARAYGWREADILALSPPRRQLYLDLLGS